jgi:hypothetical protein
VASFQRFTEWVRTFLAARCLDQPDGRPLYAYRVSDDEFLSLEALLNQWVSTFRSLATLGDFVNKVTGLAPLFVLYAAEWWRRRYDGRHWTWDPIVRRIGGDPDHWTQAQRSECVSSGLRYWRVELRKTGGLRYLGSIALQGGLPMRLLAEARGGLGRLLRTVLKQAARTNADPSELQSWIASLDHYLPRTYRQTEIFVLLAQVIETVLRVKTEAKLTQAANAVAVLDRAIPDWRQQFPLPVGDTDAQGLIDQLIKDAADAKIGRVARVLVVERHVELALDGRWTLRSTIDVPEKLAADVLAKLLPCDKADLPHTLTLSLHAGEVMVSMDLRRLAGHDTYRVGVAMWAAAGLSARSEHVARAFASDGREWSFPLPQGEPLDDDMPWVFEAQGDTRRLLRQGSGPVAPIEVMVALPPGWAPVGDVAEPRPDDPILDELGYRLCTCSGDVRFTGGDGLTCTIRSGSAAGSGEAYSHSGRRLWERFERPSLAYLGTPRLCITEGEGLPRPAPNVSWRPIGTAAPRPGVPLGPVELRYPASGEVKHRAKMVVLPESACLRLQPSGTDRGTIRFERWGARRIAMVTPGVRLTDSIDGTTLVAELAVSDGLPPTEVEVDLYWASTPAPVRMVLPFPARGARVLDANGRPMADHSVIAVDALTGIRIRVLRADAPQNLALEFAVAGTSLRSTTTLRTQPDALQTEVRLQDHATQVLYLLAATDVLDARVVVQLRMGGRIEATVHVARFELGLDRLEGRGVVANAPSSRAELDSLAGTPMRTMRFDAPDLEPVTLERIEDEGTSRAAWLFDPAQRGPGAWLIYADASASLKVRPLLWSVLGDGDAGGTLAAAIRVPDKHTRIREIDKVVASLAQDFVDPDWADVEKLAATVGHLPLAALDLWRSFAHSPEAIAAIALRFSASISGEFVERFAVELPCALEAVTYRAWTRALQLLHAQCEAWFGAPGAPAVLELHVRSRVDRLVARCPAIAFQLNIAVSMVLNWRTEDLKAMRAWGALGAANRLFDGTSCEMQRLLRANAEARWPTQLGSVVEEARLDSQIGRFCYPIPDDRSSVVNLPLVLAAMTAQRGRIKEFQSPASIHDLRTYIAFDPDWFAEAFNMTIARCLAEDRLRHE